MESNQQIELSREENEFNPLRNSLDENIKTEEQAKNFIRQMDSLNEESEISRLKEENRRLEDVTTNLCGDNLVLKIDNDRLQEENKSLKENIETLREIKENVRRERNLWMNACDRKTNEIRALEYRLKSLEDEMRRIKEDLEDVERGNPD